MSIVDTLPIFYNVDVHGFYQKQKSEFHFQQKTDNEFLMFLLDTAVRVISIVQHLAPVIEAVSDASAEVDELEDMSPVATPPNNITPGNNSGVMEVDNMVDTNPTQTAVPPLSAELEQINLEITNAQISSQPSQPIQSQTIPSIPKPRLNHNIPVMQNVFQLPKPQLSQSQVTVPQQPAQPQVTTSQSAPHVPDIPQIILPQPQISSQPQMSSQPQISSQAQISSQPQISSHTTLPQTTQQQPTQSVDLIPPSVPQPLPVSTQSNVSLNMSTAQPSVEQPIADAPLDVDISQLKSEEKPVPEVIEIKEELKDTADDIIQTSAASSLISQDTLQQLMSSISNNEEHVGIQNLVTTAAPSNLPPSFLDRSATNPLSMLGSLNSGDTPGPSGLNVPNIPESMIKNINDAGLNVSNIKGQANPNVEKLEGVVWTGGEYVDFRIRNPKYYDNKTCPLCWRVFTTRPTMKRHFKHVHLKQKDFECPHCVQRFTRKDGMKKHIKHYHKEKQDDSEVG